MFMCYWKWNYTKTTQLSLCIFARGIKNDIWPACNDVKHFSFTVSTSEKRKDKLKNPHKIIKQPRCLQVLTSSSLLCHVCSVQSAVEFVLMIPFLNSVCLCPLDQCIFRAFKEVEVFSENRRTLEFSQL